MGGAKFSSHVVLNDLGFSDSEVTAAITLTEYKPASERKAPNVIGYIEGLLCIFSIYVNKIPQPDYGLRREVKLVPGIGRFNTNIYL